MGSQLSPAEWISCRLAKMQQDEHAMSSLPSSRIFVEIISTLAVVLGLVFVGIELRHANNLAQSEAMNSLNEMIIELNTSKYSAPASTDLWANYYSGRTGTGAELSPSDREILGSNLMSWMTLYEAAWKYYDTGILGEEEFLGYIKGACDELALSELNSEVWTQNKALFTPDYVKELESTCEGP